MHTHEEIKRLVAEIVKHGGMVAVCIPTEDKGDGFFFKADSRCQVHQTIRRLAKMTVGMSAATAEIIKLFGTDCGDAREIKHLWDALVEEEIAACMETATLSGRLSN